LNNILILLLVSKNYSLMIILNRDILIILETKNGFIILFMNKIKLNIILKTIIQIIEIYSNAVLNQIVYIIYHCV
jgi:hypothetical protein